MAALGLAGFLTGCSSTSDSSRTGLIVGTTLGTLGGLGILNTETKKENKNEPIIFCDAGPIYRQSLVKRVSDVPIEIRNVPAHPDDSQVSIGPIADDEVYVRDRFGGFFRIGPKLNLGGIYIKPGIELEISGSQNPETPERNYTNYPGTNQRGYGAALTYYNIHTQCGDESNTFFFPKLFLGLEAKISDSISLGLASNVWREDLVAETGYDRYDSLEMNEVSNLVDMTIGSIAITLNFKNENGNGLFMSAGIQKILDKNYSSVGEKADIEFTENPLLFSLGGSLRF